MFSRWSTIAIIACWLASMSWLVVTKVVPPLLIGEPPNYRTILDDLDDGEEAPQAWDIHWNDEQVGWATSRITRRDDDVAELRTEVFIARLPVDELVPTWLGGLVDDLEKYPTDFNLRSENRVEVDPLGNLVGIISDLELCGIPIHMDGTVEGSQLKFTVSSLGFRYTTHAYLPVGSMVGGVLSPQSRLGRLRVGQTWTLPVYSPFTPRGRPLEVLEAHVKREEMLMFHGRPVKTWLVVYHADQGAGLRSAEKAKGRLWVRADGVVLRQEMIVLGSVLTFVRSERDPDERPELPRPEKS